jgi:hypothetical protein
MSDEIIKVLEYLSEKVGLAIDWTSEKIASDIMPYLQEVYHRCVIWGIVQNLVGVFVGAALIVSAIVILRKLLKAYKGETKDDITLFDGGDPTLLGTIAIICVITFSVSGFIVFLVALSDTIGWAIFPEGQILKTISNFVG